MMRGLDLVDGRSLLRLLWELLAEMGVRSKRDWSKFYAGEISVLCLGNKSVRGFQINVMLYCEGVGLNCITRRDLTTLCYYFLFPGASIFQ